MVEHPIQHDTDATLVGMLDQVLPVLLCSKVGVDLPVILCIVGVVGPGIEERVEVNRIDTQRFQVVQVLVHALEVAAEVIAPTRSFLVGLQAGGVSSKRHGQVVPAIRVIAAVTLGQVPHFIFSTGSS